MDKSQNCEEQPEQSTNDPITHIPEFVIGQEIKGPIGAVLLVVGLGATAIELKSGAGHHLSHELGLNIAERVLWSSPGLITTYGGQNWLRGRPYLKGWFGIRSPN